MVLFFSLELIFTQTVYLSLWDSMVENETFTRPFWQYEITKNDNLLSQKYHIKELYIQIQELLSVHVSTFNEYSIVSEIGHMLYAAKN